MNGRMRLPNVWMIIFGVSSIGFTAESLALSQNQDESGQIQSNSTPINPGQSKFEVVSVARSNIDHRGLMGPYVYPGGKVSCGFCTVEALLRIAFDIEPFQIANSPSWVRSEFYDVTGLPPESSASIKLNPASPRSSLTDEQREMLRSVLIDRFQLRFHHEKREGTVYLLTKNRNSSGLSKPGDPTAVPWVGSNIRGAINGDGIAGVNISMGILAKRLSRYLGATVIDQTGLQGAYDFQYKYSESEPVKNQTELIPTIITSLKGIGLDLKEAKGEYDVIVIDAVQRPSPD